MRSMSNSTPRPGRRGHRNLPILRSDRVRDNIRCQRSTPPDGKGTFHQRTRPRHTDVRDRRRCDARARMIPGFLLRTDHLTIEVARTHDRLDLHGLPEVFRGVPTQASEKLSPCSTRPLHAFRFSCGKVLLGRALEEQVLPVGLTAIRARRPLQQNGDTHGETPPGPRAQAGLSTIFQYESFRATLPSRNSQWSHPRTRTGRPSGAVPVRSHSETPLSPLTQCRSSL